MIWHGTVVNVQVVFTYLQNVGKCNLGGPVPLERVDANIPVRCHIWMVNLGEEEPPRRRVREIIAQNKLDVERASVVRRARWRYPGLYVQDTPVGVRGGKREEGDV